MPREHPPAEIDRGWELVQRDWEVRQREPTQVVARVVVGCAFVRRVAGWCLRRARRMIGGRRARHAGA